MGRQLNSPSVEDASLYIRNYIQEKMSSKRLLNQKKGCNKFDLF